MKVTLSPDDVNRAIVAYAREQLGHPQGKVAVVRTVAKRGGGVEADVIIVSDSDGEGAS